MTGMAAEPRLFEEPPEDVTARGADAAPLAGTFADIVFDRPLDTTYTYAVPDEFVEALHPGMRVEVPFGRGELLHMARAPAWQRGEGPSAGKRVSVPFISFGLDRGGSHAVLHPERR